MIVCGVAVLGGAMFRDFAIVATAFGADLDTIKKADFIGALSIILGVVISFIIGALIAVAFGYTNAISISTIGLNNPKSAMIFGGLMGTTSGVAGGLAATDPKRVP